MEAAPAATVAIPGVLLKFLGRASIAYAATRDRELWPHFHWLCGWSPEPDASHLTVYVSSPCEGTLIKNVALCPRVAVTVEHIGPHETYQFKGRFAGSRVPDARDRQQAEACTARAVSAIMEIEQRFAFGAAELRRYLGTPALAVCVALEEIFLQTPGPGAGRRLVPSEGR